MITRIGGGIDIEELKQRFQNSDINWFPGHMVKATKRIEERIQAADLVGFSANPHPISIPLLLRRNLTWPRQTINTGSRFSLKVAVD